jgi:hypothetical protein
MLAHGLVEEQWKQRKGKEMYRKVVEQNKSSGISVKTKTSSKK